MHKTNLFHPMVHTGASTMGLILLEVAQKSLGAKRRRRAVAQQPRQRSGPGVEEEAPPSFGRNPQGAEVSWSKTFPIAFVYQAG